MFYVKLKQSNDLNLLENFASSQKVEVIGSNPLMPLWYTLACQNSSKGNALQMSNTFYESGLFLRVFVIFN